MDTLPLQQNRIRGTTLVEVTIAIGVLAVVFAGVLSHQVTLDSLRANTLSRALQTVAVNNLVNLADGTNWDELGRSIRPWSQSRLQSGGATNPPLTLGDLVGAGVVTETGHFQGSRVADDSTGNLRFYIEYYRSTANLDAARIPIPGQPGLLDQQQADPTAFRTWFAANAGTCRIVPDATVGLNDQNQLTAGNPVMVRIAVAQVDPTTGVERQTYEAFLGAQTAPQ